MVAYTGSCHCGTVKYKFEMSPPIEERKVVTCNCSYCSTTGRLLVHVPNTDFAYTEGTDNISTYRWGSQSITASFCKTCGIQVLAESRAKEFMFGKVNINARTVHEIDLETLNLHKVDGKNFSLPPFVEKD